MTEESLRERLVDILGSETYEFYETVMSGSWIWDLTVEGHGWVSPAFCEAFGYEHEEIPQGPKFWHTIAHPDDWQNVVNAANQATKHSDGVYKSKCRFRHKEGHWVSTESFGRVYGDVAVGLQVDRSEEYEKLQKLAELCRIDYDTGLLNRRGIEEALPKSVANADRYGLIAFAAMIDLDDFKDINSEHGHAAGDSVIRAVTKRMKGLLRRTDECGRTGGDEFMAVFTCRNADEAIQVVDRIRNGVSRPVTLGKGLTAAITCSAALVRVTPEMVINGNVLNEVIEKASPILIEAKGGAEKNNIASSASVFPVSMDVLSS